jgi:hypothetical protein
MAADVVSMAYWIDIAVKAAIGVVVSVVGLDYRAVKNSLHELEQSKYQLSAELQVVRVELTSMQDKLGSIDKKLDKVLYK